MSFCVQDRRYCKPDKRGNSKSVDCWDYMNQLRPVGLPCADKRSEGGKAPVRRLKSTQIADRTGCRAKFGARIDPNITYNI
jgi:hypothetical protein